MTILDLTAHLGACHDCGARIDARGVFCHACITADERRRLTPASPDRALASTAPSGSGVRSGNGAVSPSLECQPTSEPSASHNGHAPDGSTFTTTNGAGAFNTDAAQTTTA